MRDAIANENLTELEREHTDIETNIEKNKNKAVPNLIFFVCRKTIKTRGLFLKHEVNKPYHSKSCWANLTKPKSGAKKFGTMNYKI